MRPVDRPNSRTARRKLAERPVPLELRRRRRQGRGGSHSLRLIGVLVAGLGAGILYLLDDYLARHAYDLPGFLLGFAGCLAIALGTAMLAIGDRLFATIDALRRARDAASAMRRTPE